MSDEVVFDRRGGVGIATLNRPAALNALTLDMVRALAARLETWSADPDVACVVLAGAPHPSRGPTFCAGADIRFFHAAALSGDPRLGAFFADEFRLDHVVWTYPKPVVALLDGIVMGGGMGLAQGARWRLATRRTQMAMPEVGIGYFPDVGAGHFLSRCPGRIGEYLAMTGIAIGAVDAVAAGLADAVVDGDAVDGLVDALCDRATLTADAVDEIVRGHVVSATDVASITPRLPDTAAIDATFAGPDVATILRSLHDDGSPWASDTRALLDTRSPTMVAVALELVRRGRRLSLADDLRVELGMTQHAFAPGQGEAVEGIRAQVIDKDRTPRWSPASHDQVDPRRIAAYFDPVWSADAHPLCDL